jgi:hypothetical protein
MNIVRAAESGLCDFFPTDEYELGFSGGSLGAAQYPIKNRVRVRLCGGDP